MNRRSQNRNVCWKKADLVWLLASNGVLPCASPSSVRYSRPIELVDDLPMWQWFSSSAAQRWTLKRDRRVPGEREPDTEVHRILVRAVVLELSVRLEMGDRA